MGIRDTVAGGLRSLAERFVPVDPDSSSKPFPPEAGRIISGIRDDYSISNAAREITPEKLATAVRQADMGETETMFELFDVVERDARISRLYNKRRLAVTSSKVVFREAHDDPKAKRALEHCEEHVLGLDGTGAMKKWRRFLFDLSDGIGKGLSVCQVVWDIDGGLYLPKVAEHWPNKNFRLGDPSKIFAQDEDEVRLFTCSEAYKGRALSSFAPGQWVVHVDKAYSQPLARAALFRSVLWFYLLKNYGLRDWGLFLERLGIPPRLGYYDTDDVEEKAAIRKAVFSLGKDHAAILPVDSKIELLESKFTSSGSPHRDLVKHCNDEIAVAISGSTMSAEQGDKGARSAKEAFQNEERSQAENDALNLAETLREQLLAPLVALNLGPDYPVPIVEFQIDEDEDLHERAKRDKILFGELGVPVEKSYFYQRYDIPEPPENVEPEKLLEREEMEDLGGPALKDRDDRVQIPMGPEAFARLLENPDEIEELRATARALADGKKKSSSGLLRTLYPRR